MLHAVSAVRIFEFVLLWFAVFQIARGLSEATPPLLTLLLLLVTPSLFTLLDNSSDAFFAGVSGIALWQMARALTGKGCRIAGAAKIAALHSMMWRSEQPEGEGRPDADDLSQARLLARTLHARLSSGTTSPLELSALDYQPPELAARFKQQLDHPWSGIARTVDDDLCDECGECAQSCPVDAITLDPSPVFGEACFHCCNCIRLCPNEAIVPEIALTDLEAMIRTRVRSIDEQPRSQIFLAGEPGGH